jgi:hypothetical protein
MFLALWEFDVKPGCDERLVSVSGPSGDWAGFFVAIPHTKELSSCVMPFAPPHTRRAISENPGKPRKRFSKTTETLTIDKSPEKLAIAEREIGG